MIYIKQEMTTIRKTNYVLHYHLIQIKWIVPKWMKTNHTMQLEMLRIIKFKVVDKDKVWSMLQKYALTLKIAGNS